MGNSTLSTRGRKGQGGSATLLGDHIDLLDNAAMDATGSAGGFRNRQLRAAAEPIHQGDGGERNVVCWANDTIGGGVRCRRNDGSGF